MISWKFPLVYLCKRAIKGPTIVFNPGGKFVFGWGNQGTFVSALNENLQISPDMRVYMFVFYVMQSLLVKMMAGGGGELPPHIPLAYQQEYSSESFRNPANAPLRKLTVDLIKTYRKINEVGGLGCM